MDPKVAATLVQSALYGLISVLIILVGVLSKKWYEAREESQQKRDEAMERTLSGLSANIGKLTDVLIAVDKTTALNVQKITEHDAQLRDLWSQTCQNPSCPYHLTSK